MHFFTNSFEALSNAFFYKFICSVVKCIFLQIHLERCQKQSARNLNKLDKSVAYLGFGKHFIVLVLDVIHSSIDWWWCGGLLQISSALQCGIEHLSVRYNVLQVNLKTATAIHFFTLTLIIHAKKIAQRKKQIYRSLDNFKGFKYLKKNL